MLGRKRNLFITIACFILMLLISQNIVLAYSYNEVFANVPPVIMDWACPLPSWISITSKWNQPRDIGTNPHRGIDVGASYGTDVRAVANGWLTQVGSYTIVFQIDVNGDRIKNDPQYYCYYYHLSSRQPNGYYQKGAIIGKSGNMGEDGTVYAPHLHFGGTDSSYSPTRWYRNEMNYRWTSYWNGGKDVDSYSWCTWNNNKAGITAYFKDSVGTYAPSEVVIFCRKAGTSAWTYGGQMIYQGNYTYSYDFTGKFPSGTKVQWLVRIKRGGLSVYPYCWAPSKYDQPDPDPNATLYPYPYFENTIS